MKTIHTHWITVDEMKDRLSISRNKAYQIANSGALQAVKIGSSLRVSEESLDRWLRHLSDSMDDGGNEMR